jgi:SAM-dependent methyltransferase
MVEGDLEYVDRLIADGQVAGPVLELGTGYGGSTCRELVTRRGLAYFGTDLAPGPGVDFAADFERPEDMTVFGPAAPFGSILVLNVLEHTFDPIRVLDHVRTLLRPGGSLVIIVPAIWNLHNYPMDAWRVLPNFYEVYATRRGMTLHPKYFEYIDYGPVHEFRNPDSTYVFPPAHRRRQQSWARRTALGTLNWLTKSRFTPNHVAIGAVLVQH